MTNALLVVPWVHFGIFTPNVTVLVHACRCDIGPDGAGHLARFLNDNSTFGTLWMDHNRLQDRLVMHICDNWQWHRDCFELLKVCCITLGQSPKLLAVLTLI